LITDLQGQEPGGKGKKGKNGQPKIITVLEGRALTNKNQWEGKVKK